MLTNQQVQGKMTAIDRPVVEQAVATPDPSWNDLYKAGGITAILYVLLSLTVPYIQVLTMKYDFVMDGPTLLPFIVSHRTWWMIIQTLVLGTSILAIVTFLALFIALKGVNKNYAAIGALIAIVCHILFIAYYPVLLGLTYLSDQYAVATAPQRLVLSTAAESLIAMNNGFNPLYESLFGISILILSWVMLKSVFHKWVGYLGILTGLAAFIALALWPVVGLNYFYWWLFFFVWFVAVGWKLYHLGKA